MKYFRNTTAKEKLAASVINVLFVSLVYLPFHFSKLSGGLFFVILFLFYNFVVLFFNKNRCLGMIFTNTYWKKDYPLRNHFIYTIFYTISFATIFIWIFFPFDLLLVNLFLFQLPMIWKTKTTVHGYFAGNLLTVKEIKSKI